MLDWLKDNQALTYSLIGASIAMFVGSLIVVPMVIARIPPDYFAHAKRPPSTWADSHPAVRVAVRIGKNLLGVVFIVAGLIMLGLPGQGMLTVLIGVLMLDFPGKYRFEKWLVSRKGVLRGVNWLRRKWKREPLRMEGTPAAA